MNKTVVLGSINMDLVINTERVPDKGETILGNQFLTLPGGKGANQAVAIARQGGDVSMIARLGQDKFGDEQLANLGKNKVGVENIKQDATASSGVALVLVEKDGQNRIVVVPGVNGHVSPGDVDDAEEILDQCEFLVMQLEIPLETIEYAIQFAKKKKIKTVLNASPIPQESADAEFLTSVDFLVVNEVEAQVMSGIPVTDIDSAKKAASFLQKKSNGVVVLTLGESGLVTANDGCVWHDEPFKVNVVDSTGAGDSFLGGLVASLQRGIGLEEAVIHANASGALAASKTGAQPALPTWSETEDFIKKSSR